MTRRHTGMVLIVFGFWTMHVARAEAPWPDRGPEGGLGSYDLGGVSITLERTECFGTCPSYRVVVSGNGDVVFEGLGFVDAIGVHQAAIELDDFVALVNEFLRVRFFDALDRYEGRQLVQRRGDKLFMYSQTESDHPSTILTIRLGDHEKTVVLYNNYPSDLKSLADAVDSAAKTEQWVGSDH